MTSPSTDYDLQFTGDLIMPPVHSNETFSAPASAKDVVGRILFLIGVGIVVLYYFTSRPNAAMSLPGFWYRGGLLVPFLGICFSVTGFLLQRSDAAASGSWQPTVPGRRFSRLVIYSREDCHLCDVAKDTLHKYAQWLPKIEEIDIDDSPELTERYGAEIPVVVIDGTERFRGIVKESLLRRLIEGTSVRREAPE